MSADVRRGLISIIVPVRNEAQLIRPFLIHLRERAPDGEIIVVDGGSTNATREIACDLCDQFLSANRGRAVQMNAGARAASGDTFWFLHADSEVPRGCLDEIVSALRDPSTVGGFFRIRLPHDRVVYRLTDSFAHYAGKVLRIRCGDHGFFCRREIFEKLGGFPDVPLMEDVEFFRALHRMGRVCVVNARLIANPRRYEQIGPAKLTMAYGLIATLYAVGVPLRILAAIYRRACSISESENADSSPLLNTCGWRSNTVSRSRSS